MDMSIAQSSCLFLMFYSNHCFFPPLLLITAFSIQGIPLSMAVKCLIVCKYDFLMRKLSTDPVILRREEIDIYCNVDIDIDGWL